MKNIVAGLRSNLNSWLKSAASRASGWAATVRHIHAMEMFLRRWQSVDWDKHKDRLRCLIKHDWRPTKIKTKLSTDHLSYIVRCKRCGKEKLIRAKSK